MSKIDHTTMDKYVNGVKVQEGKKEEDKAYEIGQYWWKKRGTEMAEAIGATIKFISHHQSTRVEQLVASTRLYGSSSPFNFVGPALSKTAYASGSSANSRISFNLCSSVVDTLTSKIAKNKVIPTYITSGGVWGMQKKAEQLTKFVEGCFYENDMHTKTVCAFRDGAVWGPGIVHVFQENDRVAVERVFPHELFVDQIEAVSGKPRQIHRVKLVDRAILLEMFKDNDEAIEAIEKANPASYVNIGIDGTVADILQVNESWHLRSGPDCDDGVHAITIDNTVLTPDDELSYTKDYFPFPIFHYSDPLIGIWGPGACQRLQNLQLEINRLMLLDQKSRWMMSSFKILIENGSKIVAQHLNNDVGSLIFYSGTPPQYVLPPAIDPSNETKLDSLIAKGFQQEGVSQLEASSLKPMGLDSGQALRTYNQIADDRMQFVQQQVEQFVLEVARQMVEEAKDIYARKHSYKVVFPTTRFLETVDWKDIKLKEDEYVLKAFPTSSLPEEPSAKLQYVQEQAQAGFISPRAARRLLEQPDVEMSDKLANAAEDYLHRLFEDMLYEEAYVPVDGTMDLQLASQLYLEYRNYARLNNCPQDKISVLDRFKASIDDVLAQAQAAMAPPMPQEGPPMANPTPAPVSPLIPNVNTASIQ